MHLCIPLLRVPAAVWMNPHPTNLSFYIDFIHVRNAFMHSVFGFANLYLLVKHLLKCDKIFLVMKNEPAQAQINTVKKLRL